MRGAKFFVLLTLFAPCAANVNIASRTTPAPRSRKAPPKKVDEKFPISRGGAGPLPRERVAQFATILSILNSGLISLAPVKTLSMYGLDRTPIAEYVTEWIGHISTSQAITAYCLHFGHAGVDAAVGAGILYTVVFTVKSLLNDMPKTLGFSASGQYAFLAVNAFCGHALLSGAPHSKSVLRAYPFWGVVNALPFCFAPETIGKRWGVEGSPQVVYEMKQTGFVLATKAVYYLALALGVEKTKALGYSNVPALVGMIVTNFITGEVEKFGLSSNMQYIFFFFKIFFIYALAF